MTIVLIISAIIAVGLLAYLFFMLFKGDKI